MQQSADDAAHEQYGNKDGNERQRHRQDGKADFAGALDRRLHGRIAGLHVTNDVFQHDDGVVDDEADRERKRHQREIVEAVAQQAHAGKGADDGDRQRQRRDDGRGKIA